MLFREVVGTLTQYTRGSKEGRYGLRLQALDIAYYSEAVNFLCPSRRQKQLYKEHLATSNSVMVNHIIIRRMSKR